MKKIIKIVFSVLAVITTCYVFAGIIDRKQQNKRKKQAVQENRSVHMPYGPYEKYFKRSLDFLISATALIVLFPVMVVIALLVWIKLGSPVIFKQERPGKNEKIFTLFKFRSMSDKRDNAGKLLPDEERMTPFGEWLRSTSMDELPELINIVKGDMSFVGPRPLLVEYLERYNKEQRHRHDVRPGLTGLAQINGRFNILWKTKFKYDCDYVKKITFIGDFKILIKTILVVFKKENIENEKLGSYYPFLGNDVEDQLLDGTDKCH